MVHVNVDPAPRLDAEAFLEIRTPAPSHFAVLEIDQGARPGSGEGWVIGYDRQQPLCLNDPGCLGEQHFDVGDVLQNKRGVGPVELSSR